MKRLGEVTLRRTATQIGIQTALLLMMSLLVVSAVVYATVLRSQNALVTDTLDKAMSQVRANGDFDHDHDQDGDTGRPSRAIRAAVLSGDQLRVTADTPAGLPDRVLMDQVQRDGQPDRRTVSVASGRYALLTDKRGDQVTQVMYSLFEQHQERERILGALGLAGGVGVALSTLLGVWLARRAVRPMSEALTLQRRFVADAGHELRTPVTLLSTRAQLLRRRLATQPGLVPGSAPAELENLVLRDADGIVADTQTLAAILEELLVAADTRTPVLDEPVDLTAVASDAVAAAQASAEEQSITLTFHSSSAAAITSGTRAALSRAVTALIDNALAHAATRVDVEVTQGKPGIAIRVSDDGPGIAQAVLPGMFERYAGDRSQERSGRRHYGLGLALVSEIVHRHGGTVAATSRSAPAHGAVLTVTVPISNPKGR